MSIRMQSVESSMIRAIGYDDTRNSMRIAFRNGRVYDYFLVPRKVFDQFASAPSKGDFFLEHFQKGPYKGKLISGP